MVGEILSGLGSLVGAGTGIYNSIQGNKLNKEQFEYQKDLQNKIFEREDTAVQRRVKDLEASGFSKWLATGQSASSGSVVNTNLEHKNLDMSQAISGIYSLGEMMYNLKQQEANIGLSNAQAGLLQSQVLTEAQKRINMIKESELTEAQKNKLIEDTTEMINSINWHWQNVGRPRDYQRGQVGQIAEDVVGGAAAAVNDTVRSIKNFFTGGKK